MIAFALGNNSSDRDWGCGEGILALAAEIIG